MERIEKARVVWKQPCLEYMPKFLFINSEESILSLKGYAKMFIDKGLPADYIIPPCPNIQEYFVARFGGRENKYFCQGGKLDSLINKYRCSYCSRQLVTSFKCARCQAAHYCDKRCQRKHWKSGHKRECIKERKKITSEPAQDRSIEQASFHILIISIIIFISIDLCLNNGIFIGL